MKSLPVGLAAVTLAASLATSAPAGDSPVRQIADFGRIVQDAKSKVFPAVVYIKCVREGSEAGKKQAQQVSGSGVIISPEGDVLTNWHVIHKATSIRCLLSDGRHAPGRVIGSDQDTDLAVVRLEFEETASLPAATIGDSSQLKEGDFVMAMGAPWGLNRSVSIGIVSCAKRYLNSVSEYSHWIQTDAAINPGNSGGPLVNTSGEIVGINSRGMRGFAEGMGFAIPSETIAIVLPQLIEHGSMNWSWTGLQLQPLRDFDRDIYFEETTGVIVAETDPNSPARRAGVLAKARIVRVGGHSGTVLTLEDLPSVSRWLGLLPKGKDTVFEIVRGGDTIEITIAPREKGEVEGEDLALERFDFSVKAINQFENPQLHFYRPEGVFVFGVKQPGNALNARLRPKDIILNIDGHEINTIDDVKRLHEGLIESVDSKHRVVIAVLRGVLWRQLVLDFGRDFSKD